MQTTFAIVCDGKSVEVRADYLEGSYSDEVWETAEKIARNNPGKVVGVYQICYWVELPEGQQKIINLGKS